MLKPNYTNQLLKPALLALSLCLALLPLANPRNAFAAPIALSLSSGSAAPGGIASLSLTMDASGATEQPAGLQWDITTSSSDVTSVSAAAGPAATAAGKTIACATQSNPAVYRCLLYGINQTQIASGVVANISLTISPSTSNTQTPVQLTNWIAVSASGNPISITGTGNTLTITQPTQTTKYPRLVKLSALEGLTSIPAGVILTATVLTTSGATLETQSSLSPDASGNYTVSFLATDPQNVNIRIKAANYLSALLANIDTTVNSASALSVPSLSAGDFNNDNTINTLDYSVLNSHWNGNYPAADINRDGLINSLDFAVLKNNWNKSGL